MRASDFEFRYRFWIILLIFFVAFCCTFPPENAVQWLLSLMGMPGPVVGVFPVGPVAHAIFALGAVLVAVAAWIRTWGTAYLNNSVVQDSVVRAERLVADGPYRYVRNPLYLGSLLMAAGIGLLASPIGWVVLMAGMTVFSLRLIGREEAFLRENQGADYQAYLERVPRLRPSLRPRVPTGGVEPGWNQAWVGEIGMWVLFIGSAYFALTLNGKVFGIIVIAGLLGSRVTKRLTKPKVRPRRP